MVRRLTITMYRVVFARFDESPNLSGPANHRSWRMLNREFSGHPFTWVESS